MVYTNIRMHIVIYMDVYGYTAEMFIVHTNQKIDETASQYLQCWTTYRDNWINDCNQTFFSSSWTKPLSSSVSFVIPSTTNLVTISKPFLNDSDFPCKQGNLFTMRYTFGWTKQRLWWQVLQDRVLVDQGSSTRNPRLDWAKLAVGSKVRRGSKVKGQTWGQRSDVGGWNRVSRYQSCPCASRCWSIR